MSEQIEQMFQDALIRINYRAVMRMLDARTEIRAMSQFARRSLGQRVRYCKRISK